jgi:iron(III) transport system substrate-binding protein
MGGFSVKTCVAAALIGLSLADAAAALAQAKPNEAATAELALALDKDRQQTLFDGAKKEGEVELYYSVGDLDGVIEAFTKKYGIKVKGWKSNSENVLRRVITEAENGRAEVDLVQNNGPEMEALHREKLLQKVNSPAQADLIPQAVPAHKEWVGTNMDVYVQGYNTNKIKKEDLPKTYQDLLDPKWKGKLGVEADDQAWFGTLVQYMGQDKGVQLFKNIVDTNGMSIRKGHAMLTNLTVAGEVPLSLSNYNYRLEQQKQKGAPIDYFILQPAIAGVPGEGLMKKAVHPYAALLFYDFVLSEEAQEILLKRFHIPVNRKIDSAWNKVSVKFIDSATSLDLNEQRIKLYEDTVTKRIKQ